MGTESNIEGLPLEIEYAASLETQLLHVREQLALLASQVEEMGGFIRLGPEVTQRLAEVDEVLSPSFATDERVVFTTVGSGRTFPLGAHRRTGRIIKSGQTEYSFLVQLDEPLGEHAVVNASVISLSRLPG